MAEKQTWGAGSLLDQAIVAESKVVAADATKDVSNLACWDTNPVIVESIVAHGKIDAEVVFAPDLKIWVAFHRAVEQ